MNKEICDRIIIKNLEVFAYHGVFGFEKQKGQTFYISAVIYTDTQKAGLNDNLDDTVSYAEICEKIHEFNEKNAFDLIETADGDIIFVELNLRCGASAYVLTGYDINLAGIYADHKLKGADVPDEAELKQRCAGSKDVTFASEKVLLEEYGDGNIGEKEFEDAIHSADVHFIMDKSDIMPYRKFMNAFHKIRKKQTK